MSRTMRVTFNIFVEDDFENAVKEYYNYEGAEYIDNEDIVEFLEHNIKPAESKSIVFAVEGGDTDGWFVQCVEGNLKD